MDTIFETSNRLTESVQTDSYRYLYDKINWNHRLIMLKGARGVGKTTMILQHIKNTFGTSDSALYASLDQLWFASHSISELADYHYKHGGTHLFLDEIHLYQGNWQREVKVIHDSYPGYHVVFTGSSLLQLDSSLADLSRRCVDYTLTGLSFREYLEFEGLGKFESFSLEEILSNHRQISSEINSRIKALPLFERYSGFGYYPFYRNFDKVTYAMQIQKVIDTIISYDIPAVENVEYETLHKIRRLLMILSESTPFTLEVSALSRQTGVSRSQLLKLVGLLSKGCVLRQLHHKGIAPKEVVKPAKLLFDNTDIMVALAINPNAGTRRETFAASMLSQAHKLTMPKDGDLEADSKYLFEVGGKKKGFGQIADIPGSYVLADDIESGFGNKLPLWILGFLY